MSVRQSESKTQLTHHNDYHPATTLTLVTTTSLRMWVNLLIFGFFIRSALAERVPPNQKANFAAFKSRSDVYMRAVLANPGTPLKIDWAHYKKLIPIPGLVDNFQKQYEAVKVPYPADNVTSQVEGQPKETKAEIDNLKKASEARIASLQKEIDHLKSLLPFDQMTMEDYRESFPDLAYWPQNPEEQVGYVSKEMEAARAAHEH